MEEHERFMREALVQAQAALATDDVPVGAVIVRHGEIIARGRNRREADHDATAHAEVVALRAACAHVGHWRLDDCTMYVTLEPCAMCAGALVLSRMPRLVIGAPDPKAGAAGSVLNVVNCEQLNHRLEVVSGVLKDECAGLLRAFFAARRNV